MSAGKMMGNLFRQQGWSNDGSDEIKKLRASADWKKPYKTKLGRRLARRAARAAFRKNNLLRNKAK